MGEESLKRIVFEKIDRDVREGKISKIEGDKKKFEYIRIKEGKK
jgi:hypothetical protein